MSEGWTTSKIDASGKPCLPVHSLTVEGVLCRWWGEKEPPGAYTLSNMLIWQARAEEAEARVRELEAGLKPVHRCRPIACVVSQGPGRDWWVGELLERVADWPDESHCLHMLTPIKDIVFLITPGDATHIFVLMRAVYGRPISDAWTERILQASEQAARALLAAKEARDD